MAGVCTCTCTYTVHVYRMSLKVLMLHVHVHCICILQQACGFEYTSKLQRMFQDMSLSKDLNDRFKQHTTATEASLDGEFGGKGRYMYMYTHNQVCFKMMILMLA